MPALYSSWEACWPCWRDDGESVDFAGADSLYAHALQVLRKLRLRVPIVCYQHVPSVVNVGALGHHGDNGPHGHSRNLGGSCFVLPAVEVGVVLVPCLCIIHRKGLEVILCRFARVVAASFVAALERDDGFVDRNFPPHLPINFCLLRHVVHETMHLPETVSFIRFFQRLSAHRP